METSDCAVAELFNWWRMSDWPAIRTAVLGTEPPATLPGPTVPASPVPAVPAAPRRRAWWPGARTP